MNMHASEHTMMQSIVNATMGGQLPPPPAEIIIDVPNTVSTGGYGRRIYAGDKLPKRAVENPDPRGAERRALQSEIDRYLAAGGKINRVGLSATGLTAEQKKELRAASKPEKE